MIHYPLTSTSAQGTPGDRVFSVCPAGVLESRIIVPDERRPLPPIVAIHGISRNASEIAAAFEEAAQRSGRIVIVPHFPRQSWPVYQRITRRARPDRALLALFSTLRAMSPEFHGPVDLFGFSGGAQLAHRFAMLYPETVGQLHIGSAGWYTLPSADSVYPYGLSCPEHQSQPWARRMRSGLGDFLQRDITVYVGDADTRRDESLRSNPQLDREQGVDRLARARNYVACLNEQRRRHAMEGSARLVELSGCDHSFKQCARRGALAASVCAAR